MQKNEVKRTLGVLIAITGLIGACYSSTGEEVTETNRKTGLMSKTTVSRRDEHNRLMVPVCPEDDNHGGRCGAWKVVADDGSSIATAKPDDTQGGVTGWGAKELADAYAIPTGLPTQSTVAVIAGNDYPNVEADLGVYRSTYGLPPCTTANGCFRKVNQSGASIPLQSQVPVAKETENVLDVDMVSAGCPNCKILVVEVNGLSEANFGGAMATAVSLGANAVTLSYYQGHEQLNTNQTDPNLSTYNNYFSQNSAGTPYAIPIFVDSGDYGAYTDTGGYTNTPLLPASAPNVIAVGGTVLTQNTSVARGWTEAAWSGSGAGCSTAYAKPSYQTDNGCANRTITDISAVASNVLTYDSGNGGWLITGGTSASTPLVAAIHALLGLTNAVGASFQYSHASDYFDVTTGSSGSCGTYLCNAQAGFDGPTGLGTPNGDALDPPGAIGLNPRINSASQNSVGGLNVYTYGYLGTDTSKISYAVYGLPTGVTYTGGESYYNGGQPFATLNLTVSSSAPITSVPARVTVAITSTASTPSQTYYSNGTLAITSCVPKSCGLYCGSGSDGCGGTFSCGNNCGANYTCKNNSCVLTNPNSCPCGGTKPHCQLCQISPGGDGGSISDVETPQIDSNP